MSDFAKMVEKFEKKSGEKFYWRGDYNLTIDEEDASFLQWKVMGSVVFIAETCGSAKKWEDFATEIAKMNGLKFLCTFIRRNHKAYRKLTGSQVLYNFKDDDGNLVYCMFKEVA